ncbi:E3 ubiquitin-protein ligase MARCH2 [Folsomia candida]|uniref:E3 ubiquitin-protein ligase MARCH2 n=1 Tax=Folsomia candida TaxID=158441 RepID=A0A226EGT4_FOLCA|nr:E3 ubiquitin-protein ligase MARCH2 [Folsomia candida]
MSDQDEQNKKPTKDEKDDTCQPQKQGHENDEIPGSSSAQSTTSAFESVSQMKPQQGQIAQGQNLPPRKFAPLIHHRCPIRAYHSAEETMIQPEMQNNNNNLQQQQTHQESEVGGKNLPRQKSFSTDAIRPESSPTESTNSSNLKNYIFQGRLFRKIKVTPSNTSTCDATKTVVVQDVLLTQSPALCASGQGNILMGRRLCSTGGCKMGETCINVINVSGSTDSLENICRICHDSPSSEKLIKPCLCKGSMGNVHRTCLERWLGESGKGSCEICGQEFNTVRVPKYRGLRSFIAWVRHPMNPTDSRNFFFDLACFFILTPLALLSGWLCIVGAETYANDQQRKLHESHLQGHETLSMRGRRDVSNSTWTSIGLLSLTGTLVAAYMIWIFVAFRYHIQVWREWQQRNYIVTIVPLANGEFCFPPAPPEERVSRSRTQHPDGERHPRQNRDSNENLNEDDASPTTRFIQQLFIPSLANWEAANNVNSPDNSNARDNNKNSTHATGEALHNENGATNCSRKESDNQILHDFDDQEPTSVQVVPSKNESGMC